MLHIINALNLKKSIQTLLSPDCSGNPFPFFFKKEKIEAKSGNMIYKYSKAFRFNKI